jgi:Spy/CpxP family protein refolding chaperone
MRRVFLPMLMLFFLAAASLPAAAQQGDDQAADAARQNRAAALERLEMVRVYLLVEKLDLTSEQSSRLIPIVQKYDSQFRDIIERKEQTYLAIDQEIQAPKPDTKKLAELTAMVLSMDRETISLREEQYDELKKQLTPLQYAKFMIFERKYHGEIYRILEDIRARRPGGPPPKPRPQQ